MTFRSRAFLDLCAGRPCVNCGRCDGSIVAAHRNRGKGMGIKAPDSWTVPLCYGCHSEYDSNAWTDDKFTRLYAIHMDELLTEGALTVTGHVERTKRIKPMPKILPRRV